MPETDLATTSAADLARMFAYIVFVIVIAAVLNSFVSWLEARGRRH